jgi:hypothetical protein
MRPHTGMQTAVGGFKSLLTLLVAVRDAERQVSGAAKSGSEARADAVRRRLQTLVGRRMDGKRHSFSPLPAPVSLTAPPTTVAHHLHTRPCASGVS